jgi:spermidine/putrescine transport system substrate-binding protein
MQKRISISALAVCLALVAVAGVYAGGQKEGAAAPKSKTLSMLIWEGYAEKEWVKPFEEKYGVQITATYIGSTDEMFAKMVAGKGSGYDLIAGNIGQMDQFAEAKVIIPLDMSKIPEYQNMDPRFRKSTEKITVIGGKQWVVPFVYGDLPLLYNADVVKPAPTSWAILWDPKYKGRLSVIDEAQVSIPIAAMVLGFPDPFKLTDSQLEQCKQKLIEQKPLLRKYHVGFGEEQNLFLSKEVVACVSHGTMSTMVLRDKGMNVAEGNPKEGLLGWCDGWSISAGAQDKGLAYTWINYCISKDVQVDVLRKSLYPVVNRKVVSELTPNEIKAFHMDDPEYSLKLVLMKPPEDLAKRLKIWNEVKASE